MEPIHSPTMAPMTHVVEAILRAANRNGRELWSRILNSTSRPLADRTRISSSIWGLTALSPRTMLTRVGKKQMRAAMTIFGA